MIRVLHLLPDFEVGGGQVLLRRTIAALPEVDHVVAGVGPGPMGEAFRSDGHRVEVLAPSSHHLASGLRQASRLVRTADIDLLHLNNTWQDRLVGQAAALPWRVPVVATLHGMAPARPGANLIRRANGVLARHHVRHFVAVSEHVGASYCHALRLDGDRVSVVYPGLPDEAFAPPADDDQRQLRRDLGLGSNEDVILCVARLVPGKGHELLVPMMERLRSVGCEARLLLAGDGPLRAAIEHDVRGRQLTEQVLLLGHRPDVRRLLHLAAVVVSASASEGFPLNILEGLAAARPVVATPLPALSELARGGAMRVTTSNNPDDLAVAVNAVLSDPEAAAALARRGRAAAESFRASTTAAGWLAVYEAVLAAHSNAARRRPRLRPVTGQAG